MLKTYMLKDPKFKRGIYRQTSSDKYLVFIMNEEHFLRGGKMANEVLAKDKITEFRDIQVAHEIQSMAALGVFPKGIIVYGLVYFKDGKRQYMISEDPVNVISFLNDVENQKYFPSPIDSYSERLIIPEGYEEDIINGIKIKLARQLQETYPEEVFLLLRELDGTPGNSAMEDVLRAYRNEMEVVFDEDKIEAFRDLCTRAFTRKNLSELAYQELTEWCQKRLLQLVDYVPPVGNKEKSFYGFSVIEDHKVSRTIINANLKCIYQDKRSLEDKGNACTLWHKKTFTVMQQESLRGIQEQMKHHIESIYDEQMIQVMEQLDHTTSVVDSVRMQDIMQKLSVFGQKAVDLGAYYGKLWGVKITLERRKNNHES